MTVPFEIQDIDHVVLRVSDRERMVRFYCGVLGCTVDKVQDRIGLVHLRAGRALIDLFDRGAAEREAGSGNGVTNMDHVCLAVDPFDQEALTAHLRAHGVDPGEIATRYGARGDGPSLYLHDPEGNMVELKGRSHSTGAGFAS
jgi:glyoxylase I family protein